MATATKSRRTSKKAAPVEEDLEEDDIEETEDEDEAEEEPAPRSRKKAPAKKAPAKKAPAEKADVKGTAWLKDHINEVLGTEHEGTKIRIVLRKLIKDDEIESPKDGRYVFSGPKDPNVKAVIAALRAEAKSGPAKRGRKPKAAKAVTEVEEDDEVEDLDLDDDE